MRCSAASSLLLASWCSLTFSQTTDSQPSALQTGPDKGSSFASASVYHPGLDAVILVGTTYGNAFQPHVPNSDYVSGCFLAVVRLPEDRTIKQPPLVLMDSAVLDMPDVTESCDSLVVHGNRIIAGGHANAGGLLDDFRIEGGYTEVEQYGMLLDLVVDTTADFLFGFVGGYLLQESSVSFPASLATTAGDDIVYVATMESDDADMTVKGQDLRALTLDPTRFLLSGAHSFDMVVTQLTLSSDIQSTTDGLQESLRETWRRTYATENGESVYCAGLEKLSDTTLIAAGTTVGQGTAFGLDQMPGDDLDGFVTRLSPQTGALLGDVYSTDASPARRIQSLDQRDDWISGLCRSSDRQHVYVVGSTKGKMDESVQDPAHAESVEAFLIKLDATSLSTVWAMQLGAMSTDEATRVRGVSCAETSDGGSVYMAGIIEDGAVLELANTATSFGGNDIFVAKVNAGTGQKEYVRQIGSEYDDELAMRGALAVDAKGDAIVVGNTMGSLYRQRGLDESAQLADVFVATVSRYNGNIVAPVPHHEHGAYTPSEPPASTSGPDEPATPIPGTSSLGGGLLLGFLIVTSLLVVYCIFFGRCLRKVDNETDRSKVLSYLNEFDVEDVDLKHSATGGWHCSYAGPLAHGVNSKSASRRSIVDSTSDGLLHADHLTTPLTGGTSIIDNSFFNDEDERQSVGLDDNVRPGSYSSKFEEARASIRPSRAQRGDSKGSWGRDII